MMTDAPAVVHIARTCHDNTATTTLCGKKVRTNTKAVNRVKQGPWVSCPLCEAALALDGTPNPYPRRRSPTWIQPTLF
ncbi:hypothetical protein [Bifidobacterium sp. SO4]|uniref:hypothetical protein n=1 Tax=Bifidobacterium sp. SO4 TaxID=2809030 RepID=UPI001BDBF340|nr:hypothetical protein [Bifidobacterium sp. SO4]MBT1169598.1 hypothetical protein [Bifidobacterium sp. SO4]